MKNPVLIFSFLVIAVVSYGQEKPVATLVEPSEFEESIFYEDVVLIDVRTPEEFSEGHIEGARNIDFLSDEFAEHFNEIDKNKHLYIYCRSGNRSGKAAIKLHELGFKNITDLKGGYLAWKKFNE